MLGVSPKLSDKDLNLRTDPTNVPIQNGRHKPSSAVPSPITGALAMACGYQAFLFVVLNQYERGMHPGATFSQQNWVPSFCAETRCQHVPTTSVGTPFKGIKVKTAVADVG